MITNTVHILTPGKVLFHLLYADDDKTNKYVLITQNMYKWDLKTENRRYLYCNKPYLLRNRASTLFPATFLLRDFSVYYTQCRYILGFIYTNTLKLLYSNTKALKHFPSIVPRLCTVLWFTGVHQHSFCIWLEELLRLFQLRTHFSVKVWGGVPKTTVPALWLPRDGSLIRIFIASRCWWQETVTNLNQCRTVMVKMPPVCYTSDEDSPPFRSLHCEFPLTF